MAKVQGMTTVFPRLIFWTTGGHLVSGLTFWAVWQLTQDEVWIRYFFDYQSALFFALLGGLEFVLAIWAWSQFSSNQPLRSAWLLVVLASACRLMGLVLAHVLGIRSYLNPSFFLAEPWIASRSQVLRQIGLAISGPIHMLVLACALFRVLKVYRGLKMSAKLKLIDYLLVLVVSLYTVMQMYEIVRSLPQAGQHLTVYTLLNWITDPLLSLLLFEAIFIRRYVVAMGGGLIARCWGAFTVAIFVTSLGDMGLWVVRNEYIPYPLNSITWFIWFFASAAYALGPAYQVEATRRAQSQAAIFYM